MAPAAVWAARLEARAVEARALGTYPAETAAAPGGMRFMKTALDGSGWAWAAVALLAALLSLGVWAFRGYLDPEAIFWFSNLRLC